MFFPERPPSLNLWERFGIVVPLVGFVVVAVIGTLASLGTTPVEEVAVGMCFDDSDDVEVARLETPGCGQPHDSQIVGQIELTGAPEDFPGAFDPYWDDVFDQCAAVASNVVVRADEMPGETFVLFFTPVRSDWSRGDRTIICYLHSPEGLTGSFVGDNSA